MHVLMHISFTNEYIARFCLRYDASEQKLLIHIRGSQWGDSFYGLWLISLLCGLSYMFFKDLRLKFVSFYA